MRTVEKHPFGKAKVSRITLEIADLANCGAAGDILGLPRGQSPVEQERELEGTVCKAPNHYQ